MEPLALVQQFSHLLAVMVVLGLMVRSILLVKVVVAAQ
jgi:hypothetical protein